MNSPLACGDAGKSEIGTPRACCSKPSSANVASDVAAHTSAIPRTDPVGSPRKPPTSKPPATVAVPRTRCARGAAASSQSTIPGADGSPGWLTGAPPASNSTRASTRSADPSTPEASSNTARRSPIGRPLGKPADPRSSQPERPQQRQTEQQDRGLVDAAAVVEEGRCAVPPTAGDREGRRAVHQVSVVGHHLEPDDVLPRTVGPQ